MLKTVILQQFFKALPITIIALNKLINKQLKRQMISKFTMNVKTILCKIQKLKGFHTKKFKAP
jgi:hypothetical protein